MESELARQAEILFGAAVTRQLEERPAEKVQASDRLATEESEDQTKGTAPPDAAEGVPQWLNLNMTARQQRKLWRHVESIENFWLTLKEIEVGAVQRLAAMATDRRWEVIFLTKRPATAGMTAQQQSQRWLEARGFKLPSVYVVPGLRGRIAAALNLDIVVDDRPENCLDVVVDSKARASLVWRDDEKRLPGAARRLGIGVVKSVGECLDILTQVDSSGREPGVMNRVMRLLGLKEPASV
jgi:hypothetical protein